MKAKSPHLIGLRSGLRSAALARLAEATARQALTLEPAPSPHPSPPTGERVPAERGQEFGSGIGLHLT